MVTTDTVVEGKDKRPQNPLNFRVISLVIDESYYPSPIVVDILYCDPRTLFDHIELTDYMYGP